MWGLHDKLVRGDSLHMCHQTFSVSKTTTLTGTVNVFKRGITPPGHSEVSLAAVTMSCWTQLCTDFGGLAGKLCGHYCTYLHTCIHANVADVFSALNIVLNKDMNKVIVYCCCISASELSESCLLLLIIPTTEFAHCSVWQVAYVCQAQNLFYIFSIYLI